MSGHLIIDYTVRSCRHHSIKFSSSCLRHFAALRFNVKGQLEFGKKVLPDSIITTGGGKSFNAKRRPVSWPFAKFRTKRVTSGKILALNFQLNFQVLSGSDHLHVFALMHCDTVPKKLNWNNFWLNLTRGVIFIWIWSKFSLIWLKTDKIGQKVTEL